MELFRQQALRRRNHPALILGEETVTYEQLDAWSDCMAGWLRQRGVARGAFVGLFVERCLKAYVSLLGILKAGAAYIPLDPQCPAQRVGEIANDCGLALLLTQRELESRATHHWNGPVARIEELEFLPAGDADPRSLGAEVPAPDDLCYVIFTSGSTGRPKGVMLEHRNVAHYVQAASQAYAITEEDRIFQGFSLAFDASVEELWMAWANGGTLVGGSASETHCPDSIARRIAAQAVTVFSTVPTFLSLVQDPLPSVRLLILGGEVCPPELVARFAANRRMLNTYGPTETAVVATFADCRPGKPITIGRPLPGYQTLVVDEALRPVEPGQVGELLLGGPGVARGYLKRPDLTTERFLTEPGLGEGRFYRSGDRVRMSGHGDIEFIGRIDGQVKIRGFRVELPEIEAVLMEQPGIQAAAVKVDHADGIPSLCAYVIADGQFGEINREAIASALRSRLADYMVPRYLDCVASLPALPSGKVDRSSLPAPKMPLRLRKQPGEVSRKGELEQRLLTIWEEVLGESELTPDTHFFDELGGHSLLAAVLTSRLRKEPEFRGLSVKDLYEGPTIRKLARLADSQPGNAPALIPAGTQAAAEDIGSPSRYYCFALQALTICGLAALVSVPGLISFFWLRDFLHGTLPARGFLLRVAAVGLVLPPLSILTGILAKWLIVGRYRPGVYPLWGSMYLRCWVASRFQAGAGLFAGTPLMRWYLRLLGAKIGNDAVINTPHIGCPDLLMIGDNSSIGAESHLMGYRVEDGKFILGTVTIGSNCFVGIHSYLGLNTAMEDDSALDDLSCLADGQIVRKGTAQRGSPAQPAAVRMPTRISGPRRPALFALGSLLVWYGFFAAMLLAGAPALAVLWQLYWQVYRPAGLGGVLAAGPAVIAVSATGFCAVIALLKWLILGTTRPGVYPVHSLFYLRKLFVDRLIATSRAVLLPLYATVFTPIWLRCLGAKLGRRCEVSTVSSITPDTLHVGDECFLADGAVVGGMRIHRGFFQIEINRVGDRTFIGNSAVLPTGVSMPKESLLGCLSIVPAHTPPLKSRSKWLGSPPFRLPKLEPTREFSTEEIYQPANRTIRARAAVDALRILVPGLINFSAAVTGLFLLARCPGPDLHKLLLAPLLALAFAFAAALAVVLLKWTVMGRFQPVIRPLWSPYVWWNEMVNGAYEATFAPALSFLTGTPFIVPFLRLLGIKIGRNVFIESLLFSEFDLVEIGDGAALNQGATIQTHLFENRIMKSSYLKIGNRCTVGNMAVVLYDTCMAPGSALGPLSLLMKGETLPHPGTWSGIPCRESPVAAQRTCTQR